MEIFKIERRGQDKVVTPQSVSNVVEKPEADQGLVLSEKEELRQAQAIAGEEVPGGTTEATGKAEVGASDAPTYTLGDDKAPKAVIKVDGPLSKVFTEALNKILAFENMVMVPLLVEEYEEMKKDVSFNEATSIHVQAYDANELHSADVIDIADGVTKTNLETNILAMEAAKGKKLSQYVGRVENYCRSAKVNNYYSMETAAHRVASLVATLGV